MKKILHTKNKIKISYEKDNCDLKFCRKCKYYNCIFGIAVYDFGLFEN